MTFNYSRDLPVAIKKIVNKYRLNYNIHESTHEDIQRVWEIEASFGVDEEGITDRFIEEHKYCYHTVDVPMGQWNYAGVVNAIIRDKYRVDEMESITNNMAAVNAVFMQTLVTEGIVGAIQYLRESYDKDNAEIFKQMQEWRAMAKKEAKSIFVNG